jgi:geranylgeranyl diphosphate synthase type II
VLGGGKRIRPILCLEAAAASGRPSPRAALDLACAIEFIHTYSLIHDDLPALDNDDLRRGRPACHKKFGEAAAILAGDALLTRAFEVLGRLRVSPEQRARLVTELAAAAGTRGGMIAGQVEDLAAEGRRVSPRRLEAIHRAKTGALIRAAVRGGAILAGARPRVLAGLSRYAEKVGLAFQIVDDILDVRGSRARLGKPARRDAARRKATYPGVHGLAASERRAAQLIEGACAELAPLGPRAAALQQVALHLVSRSR